MGFIVNICQMPPLHNICLQFSRTHTQNKCESNVCMLFIHSMPIQISISCASLKLELRSIYTRREFMLYQNGDIHENHRIVFCLSRFRSQSHDLLVGSSAFELHSIYVILASSNSNSINGN